MSAASKTLEDIRGDACNRILFTLTALTAPGVGASVLRSIERGWHWVMGVHIALLVVLVATTLWRHHLPSATRAAIVTAVPYIVAVSGLVAYSRGNGVAMFFVSSCVLAACFFRRQIALAVVGLCVLTLALIYAGFLFDVIAFPDNATVYDMSPLSWVVLCIALVAAGAPPVIAVQAVLQSLDAERKRADAAVQVRTNFLANMSHELRTPAAAVLGMAEILKGTVLDARQQETVDNLLRSGHALLGTLNDLLDFSRFEAGALPIEKLPFKISDTVRNIGVLFETKARQKGIALRVECATPVSDAVLGDAFRISQILSNLVDNAVKFTPSGAVTLRVTQTAKDDDRLTLACTVTDTGVGIAPAQIKDIFDPFIQADMSISRAHGGSGLGLAVCRRLADAMGGEISVSSDVGRGSAFQVLLPLDIDRSPAAAPAGAAAPREDGAALRLLVAEDDKYMRILADIMLPRLGHALTMVEDGAAAVAATRGNTYDCIILDMHMPVMDGLEATGIIRANETATGRRTPIIALTADVLPERTRTFLAAGADAVIAKPVNWDVLNAKILELARP